MKINWERYLPPGMSFRIQGMTLLAGLAVSFGYSLRFMFTYFEQYQYAFSIDRYPYPEGNPAIDEFLTILGPALDGFYILAVVMLLFALWNWFYFYQESRSIYLMKRIRRRELYIRVLTLPVLTSVAVLGMAGIIFLMYRGIYYGLTPERYIH